MGNEVQGMEVPPPRLGQQLNPAAAPVAPFPLGARVAFRAPIRDFRPRRQIYSRAQKERAVRLLNLGVPCRQVAVLMGPRCSSGTPIRWRKEALRCQEARRRMEQILAQHGGQN